jgi:hypothetical protein
MRIFNFNKIEWDKKFLIANIIVLILAIISGIVLYNLAYINNYFTNFASNYVNYIFNFKNGYLFFTHLINEIFYLYLFFAITFLINFKYFTLIITFIRCIFITLYSIIICSSCGFGGVLVVICVFLPTSILSLIVCVLVCEVCFYINDKIVWLAPLILAIIITIFMLILTNILFRILILVI